MNIKKALKKAIKIIFAKRPIQMTAQIIKLSPNEMLKGRTALITGGTSGIGYAIADAMLDAGATVIISGRSETRLEDAVNRLSAVSNNRKGRIFQQQMNVSDICSLQSDLESITNKIGGGKVPVLSILVNSAGVLGAQFGSATEDEYDSVLDTNLKGTFFLSQLVAHYMIDNNIKGNILNIGSSSSNRPAASAYTVSKWGVKGLTLGMAKSLIPHGIVVNAIAPGPTATPMLIKDPKQGIANEQNPLGRYAAAEEIANMAVFLTSGMGRTVVGDMVFMTGGAGVITFDDMQYTFD